MAQPKVLVLYAHPDHHKSRINQAMIQAISDLDNIVINDLYHEYYDLHINVKREQALLLDADLIVFHHPFYWYSSPAVLKEWQDRVLTQGFAYGDEGTALKGKCLLSAVSTGGKPTAYGADGHNKYTVEELLRPFETTANLCGMHYLKPFVVQDTFSMTTSDVSEHAQRYKAELQNFQNPNKQD